MATGRTESNQAANIALTRTFTAGTMAWTVRVSVVPHRGGGGASVFLEEERPGLYRRSCLGRVSARHSTLGAARHVRGGFDGTYSRFRVQTNAPEPWAAALMELSLCSMADCDDPRAPALADLLVGASEETIGRLYADFPGFDLGDPTLGAFAGELADRGGDISLGDLEKECGPYEGHAWIARVAAELKSGRDEREEQARETEESRLAARARRDRQTNETARRLVAASPDALLEMQSDDAVDAAALLAATELGAPAEPLTRARLLELWERLAPLPRFGDFPQADRTFVQWVVGGAARDVLIALKSDGERGRAVWQRLIERSREARQKLEEREKLGWSGYSGAAGFVRSELRFWAELLPRDG